MAKELSAELNEGLYNKEVLTAKEMASYMGVSLSHLYKLTSGKEIPHYKPTGKVCFFNRKEVEAWITRHRISTKEELEDKALSYCDRKGGAR